MSKKYLKYHVTYYKEKRKITHSFSQIERTTLTHDEFLQLNNSNKEEIEILDDTEMIQFNNNYEEPTIEDYLYYTKYECLESSRNQSVDEGNFNEFCEPENPLKKEMEFFTGVSTNVNLNTENYLTDLVESSKLKIMNQKLVYDLYNSERYVGLFKCF